VRVADPAKSSRRIQAVRRRAWRGGEGQTEEEARAYIQSRLAVFSKMLFWSFVALLVFLFLMYWRYSDIEPRNQEIIYGVAITALAILAVLWRVLLVRGRPSIDALYNIDLLIIIGSGVTFGSIAALAYDLQASSYTCLLFVSFVVFTRALVVPSSAKRTLVASILAFVPIVAGAIVMALYAPALEIPGPAFVVGDLLYNAVAVILATMGSDIIYGLSKKLSEAMQLGQYTLGRKIGEGGMGAVYHAHHALLRRPTAVKLMQPHLGVDALDRFEREVQAMSQLTHPNTVAVFDYGRNPDGALYYAMEFLGGLNLEELVRRYGAQPSNRVVEILIQVCGALQEAHEQKLIHRDIKPPNILLCERGGIPDVAKVVDFGLVKELTRDQTQSTQVILGTPHYIAPEIVTDPNSISPAVDLYALGAVGYFLLTGKRVFEAKTAVEILVQHRTATPKKPSEVAAVHVPAELEAILMKCLSKSPSDRYASAREMAEALEAVPRSRDWDREEARRWWRELKAHEARPTPLSDAETMTITIDMEDRV
jgi:eukaryotic-like serine/threonine-protein kinase